MRNNNTDLDNLPDAYIVHFIIDQLQWDENLLYLLSVLCADLLNAVQNFRLHFPRGSSVLSMYLSWEPPINAAGILGYSVYLNDEIFPVGLEQFYEFTISPDTVYTASVCYEGASPCYRTSMLQFELTRDLVRSTYNTVWYKTVWYKTV